MFVERAQRRITVNYAKRQVGRRMYAGQSSHLPFKLNMSGVIPPIFASSLLLFPATIASFFGSNPDSRFSEVLQNIATSLGYGQPAHLVLYATLIVFFCFFYTALVFNSRETADNLKKSGAFIPGIRPGQQTGEYIDKGAHPPDPLGRHLHHGGVPRAGDPGLLTGSTVSVRRHIAADRRCRGDGFHGAAAGAHDVPPIATRA